MATAREAPAAGAIGWRPGRTGDRRREDRLARGIGAEVRRRRRERGLNQRQLAATVGRDRSTISRWEAGERLPPLPALVALAAALGCAPAALLPDAALAAREG